MAQEIIIRLRDDIDGTDAIKTVEFTYDGVPYEIDLSESNLAALDEAMQKFIPFARRVGRLRRKTKAKPKAPVVTAVPEPQEDAKEGQDHPYAGGRARTRELAKVREWARENGFTVGAKGKIPNEIWEAYGDAHDEQSEDTDAAS